MKITMIIASLLVTSISFAQKHKTVTQTTTTQSVPATAYSSSLNQNELVAHVGFTQSAINLGATYAQMQGSTGFGGYFHLQTEKEGVVSQVISLGALYKINIIDTNKAVFYAAPGFGLAMVKGTSSTVVIGGIPFTSKGDDKTVFGPSLKLGAQMKLTPTFALGIERGITTNWFEKEASASFEVTTVAMTFNF